MRITFSLILAAIVGAFAFSPHLAVAQFWDGGHGGPNHDAFTEANSQWNQGLNWSLNVVPVNSLTNNVNVGDTVNPFPNPDPETIAPTPDAAFIEGVAVQAGFLVVGNGTGETSRLTVQENGTVELGYDLVAGDSQGDGYITFNPGSTLVASRSILLGKRDNLTYGSLVARGSITDATTLNTNGITVGETGGGQLIIEGATVNNTGNLKVGVLGSGTVTLRGHSSGAQGTLSASKRFLIADSPGSSGTFTQQANSVFNADISTVFRIGDVGPGTYNMEGGTLNLTNTSSVPMQIGHEDTGIVNQSGGDIIVANTVALGSSSAMGTYDQTGGTLNAGLLIVGEVGQGTFNAGGTVDILGNLKVGDGSNSQGDLTLTSGGNVTANLRVLIGDQAGSTGTVTQQAGSLFTATTSRSDRPFRVGEGGAGTYNMDGGTLELINGGQVIELAAFSGSTGTFNMTNGTVTTPDIIAGSGTANFNFAGGEIFIDGNQVGFDAANAWFNVTGNTGLYVEKFLAGSNQTHLYYGGGLLQGDYNDNGVVDAADYTVWLDNLGSTNVLPNDPIGGDIGQAHYDQWKNNFGSTAGSGSVSVGAVPEPNAVILLVTAVGLVTAGACLTRGRS